jgi:hypothetical protein
MPRRHGAKRGQPVVGGTRPAPPVHMINGGGLTSIRSDRLKPYRASHIVVYLLRLKLNITPNLVAISAVIEKHVPDPEDSDTNN